MLRPPRQRKIKRPDVLYMQVLVAASPDCRRPRTSREPADVSMLFDTNHLSGPERYQLLTSLVVPRPIAWISSRSGDRTPNLAPFSFFAAVSAMPMLIAVSIGARRGALKDSLRNIIETGVFCVNFVAEAQLEAMNHTSREYPPEIDEFEQAQVPMAEGFSVDAPYVADCPATLECRLFKDIELEGSANTLIIGEVITVRVADGVHFVPGSHWVDSESLRPVGRMWGDRYALLGSSRALPRPPS